MMSLGFKSPIPEEVPRLSGYRWKEKMFLEQYSWLLECALNITHGQREQAEDLVHDVFVQFVGKDVDIAAIADIRGYLNGILRNLHLVQMRRATRHPVQSLSLIDHDSALVGLRAWSSVEQLHAADLLVRACDFACYRKETALTSSILILRFFHGYYPGEIACLLRVRRRAVDQWVVRGRTETRQYMESPYPLDEKGRNDTKMRSEPTATAFLRRLRERIFDSCRTDCSVLADDPIELEVKSLAHLVSCRVCLEERSRKMGLSHVAERMADDISDRDDGRPQGGSVGPRDAVHKPSKRAILRPACARRRELFEHYPREISLAFDGALRATLVVSAPTNTLNLSLDSKEVPNSIAILSEQEFNFLILDRNDLTSFERRLYRLPLSDERFLHVIVTPETLGPSIQVVYEDPQFLPATGVEAEEEPRSLLPADQILRFPARPADSANDATPAWWTALFGKIRGWVPTMNPLLASAMLFLLCSVISFVLWTKSGPKISASTLLSRAQLSVASLPKAGHPEVIYQRVKITRPGRTIERDIYRDPEGKRRPRKQQLNSEDQKTSNRLDMAGVSWDDPLSAASFSAWRDRQLVKKDAIIRSGSNLLTLTTSTESGSVVVEESLTVRESDFHPVSRTVELTGEGTVEIAELNYAVMPLGALNQDWFEPLSGQTVSGAPNGHGAIHLSPPPSSMALDEAELAARITLNQLRADTGEQIQLTRTPTRIDIKGVVDTDVRKQELVSRLALLSNVHTSLLSVEEIGTRPPLSSTFRSGRLTQVYSVEAQPSPLEQYLREKKLPLDQLGTISQSLLDQSLRIQHAGVHLSELRRRFREANQLPADQQNQLEQLSKNYVDAMQAGLDANQRTLVSIGLDTANQVPSPSESSPPVGDIDLGVRRYQELCQQLITSGAGAPVSAAVIAGDLKNSGLRIRTGAAEIRAFVSTARN